MVQDIFMKYYKVLDHPKKALESDLNCTPWSVSEFKTRTSGTKHNLAPFYFYKFLTRFLKTQLKGTPVPILRIKSQIRGTKKFSTPFFQLVLRISSTRES